jgi:hypothetical protein
MYGLCGGAVVAAAVLIEYDNMIVNDYFIYTNPRLRWIAAPTLVPLLSVSSDNNT